jgi:transposase
VTEHHRSRLRALLDQATQLDAKVERLSGRIEQVLPADYPDARPRLSTIPRSGSHVAECVPAEVGTDTSVFPAAVHLASWTGMCPSQRQSAGKHGSGRTRLGNGTGGCGRSWCRRREPCATC